MPTKLNRAGNQQNYVPAGNGDAEKISTYAKTNFNEFLSEANAQIESGIDTPSYIVDIVNKVKGVK